MIKIAHSIRLAAVTILAAGSLGAQEPAAELPVTPNTRLFARIERTIIRIHSIFGRPLHPVIGTVAPGSGWGAGLGYTAPTRGPLEFNVKGLWTVNNYRLAEAVLGYGGRRAEFEAFGRWRDMTQLDYFGRGPASQRFDRTTFYLRDPVLGAHGKVRVIPWLAVGARLEQMWPYARHGERESVPSIEEVFPPPLIPGFSALPRFGRYQGSIDLNLPAAPGDALYQGTRSRLTYGIYDDQKNDVFNFRRVDVEARQVFAGLGAHHRVTLSGWAATTVTDDGQEVPFYLLPTLGGRFQLQSVHEGRLGSDGTQATLRGYRDLRFRDRNLLLLQAEYRIPLWGPIDATVFADAGKVAPTRSDLDLTDLRRDFGFSFSVMKGWATAARVDVGFGSGEGTRVFLSLGDITP